MSEQEQKQGAMSQRAAEPAIFGTQPEERGGYPPAVWGVAALVVIVVVAALVYVGRKKPAAPPNTLQPADAYAASLPLSQFAMSESANLSGGKLTYLDGHVQNTGGRTVTAVTVQVVFGNDEALAPQIDTEPLMLIRMKDPYIDTQMVSANPLKPGDDREFRLTFEAVPDNWNQQMPEVRIIGTGNEVGSNPMVDFVEHGAPHITLERNFYLAKRVGGQNCLGLARFWRGLPGY